MRKGLPKGRPFQVDYDGTPYFYYIPASMK